MSEASWTTCRSLSMQMQSNSVAARASCTSLSKRNLPDASLGWTSRASQVQTRWPPGAPPLLSCIQKGAAKCNEEGSGKGGGGETNLLDLVVEILKCPRPRHLMGAV